MKKKLKLFIILAIALLIIIVGLLFAMPKIKKYLPYFYDKNGLHQEDISYTLTIEKEHFADDVAAMLYDHGIICNKVRFLNYLNKKYPDFVWYNGIYTVNAKMSYRELCETLKEPETKLNYVKIVIPEGKGIREIAEIVEKSGLCTAQEFLEAADHYDYDYPFIEALKKRDQSKIAFKLEGYLFPATYEFREDTATPREIVDKMLKAFTQYVTDDMINSAASMGLDLNEFITFGAIVQAEAFSKESMSGVASVFWNRLNSDGMKRLQSDPTTAYSKSLNNGDLANAYDTYQCIGLPSGPTNCPGTDVLKAVLNPDQTNYYYFVTDKNGAFYFNETLADHNRTIKDLVRKGLWA